MATLYEQDVMAWATQQAALLRAGRFSELDLERVAEEIADVGKSEQRELAQPHGGLAGASPEVAVSTRAPGE